MLLIQNVIHVYFATYLCSNCAKYVQNGNWEIAWTCTKFYGFANQYKRQLGLHLHPTKSNTVLSGHQNKRIFHNKSIALFRTRYMISSKASKKVNFPINSCWLVEMLFQAIHPIRNYSVTPFDARWSKLFGTSQHHYPRQGLRVNSLC